jgi:hypothetical protein
VTWFVVRAVTDYLVHGAGNKTAMSIESDRKASTFTVLMTACIEPKPRVREMLRRSDTGLRLRDYKEGLGFWLSLAESRISGVVFADNSNYPLRELEDFAAKFPSPRRPVEFISFDFPPPDPGLSYGYSEFLLVNRALEVSKLLRKTGYFIKATGRYRFPDISRLLRRLPPDFLAAVDSKGFRPFGMHSNPITCVALALFDRHFYETKIAGIPATMVPAPPWNRRQFIEPALFDALHPIRTDPRVIMRWPCNCEPAGFGSNGDNYDGLRKKLQYGLRSISRRVLPKLWI